MTMTMTQQPPRLVVVVVALLCACMAAGSSAKGGRDGGREDSGEWRLSEAQLDALFTSFVKDFGRLYASNATEHAFRRRVFARNVQLYQQRSASAATVSAGHTAVFKPDKFSDWTVEEFRALLGTRPVSTAIGNPRCASSPVNCELSTNMNTNAALGLAIPDAFDWRNDSRGVITAVRDQGQCGGCWAFSAVETVEASWVLSGHTLPEPKLSVQQILSCDTQANGCHGGSISGAFTYVLDKSEQGKGLEPDTAFPFKCDKGCKNSLPQCPALSRPFVTINATCRCPKMKEKDMLAFVANYGPLAIQVDAEPWHGYSSGIMRYHCSSQPASANHAVQIVGYGIDSSSGPAIPYWTVRNSWGEDWGENGYIRLYRGNNVCGLRNDVNFAFSQ
ncbi:hypothetical protein PTSG_01119 [Salpingoeca rosetta]|uniref:Uncharacterized protein n=1 Tax=Salpingoeca rosetta (strain ATCC 50818 / BSB-021) TaxID=946362 RepID=F2U0V4_SALR5|nr:uncharacterized protein PTSG_01119 [Salpingoeca rosetta]EGD80528.1 hypothetical protein PTSG_01119 [Salpingoeca rosetta]|eukprot:XP_004997089.1 hypothetical protein PTSG_01119 [Salpingoeca rosetta]